MSILGWLFGRNQNQKLTTKHKAVGKIRPNEIKASVQWREGSFPMDAVGESNYQRALEDITGGYTADGHDLEIQAVLVREPENPHDENAVAVQIRGKLVGYLSREQAHRVSEQMAEDQISASKCNAKIVGGWRRGRHDVGYFGVKLAVPNWGWIDFGIGKMPPQKPKSETASIQRRPRPDAAADGPLKGKKIFLWGAPANGPEADEFAQLGAQIMAGVGKSTNMVVQIDDKLTVGMKASSVYPKVQAKTASDDDFEFITLRALRKRLNSQM